MFKQFLSVALIFVYLLIPCVAQADDLNGLWQGVVSDGRKSENIRIQFSDNGYMTLTYKNNQGVVRVAELTTVGQQVKYVPPGGGVTTYTVKRVDRRTNGLTSVMGVSVEKTSNGYLSQDYTTVGYITDITANGLETQMEASGSSYTSDVGNMAGGGGNAIVANGVLQKVR